jgi:ribosome-binding factor A
LGTRVTPTLEFFEDSLPETSVAMESLLADVKKHDEEISALSAKAKPIADDPYKK